MKLSRRMVVVGLILAACERHPLDRLIDPVPSGAALRSGRRLECGHR